MNPELAKIDLYYDEVRRRWPSNAELASSRDFFLLWQQVQQPRPCALDDDEVIEIQGTILDLVDDTGRFAHTTWDAEEMTPALVLEGDTATQRVLLMIQDGEPVLDELPPVLTEDDDVTYGERLEVFYDIIDYCRRSGRGEDVRALRGQAYADALAAVADHHPPPCDSGHASSAPRLARAPFGSRSG